MAPAHPAFADVPDITGADGTGSIESDDPDSTPRIGDTTSANPGVVNVGIAAGRPVGEWGVSAFSGYGFTEAQPLEAGAHHRVAGTFAFGFTPLRGLDLALRLDGRHDTHPDDARGSDQGYSGEPRVSARFGRAVDSIHVGAEAGLWIPGRDAPSLAANATTIDARALLAWLPTSRFTLASHAGFRVDQSGKAKPDLARTRPGDRSALGLSDFNAVLAGLGASYRHGMIEWLADVSGDILVGARAPGFAQSPIRIAAGVRVHINRRFQLFALAQTSPSKRLPQGPMDPLVPMEPRFQAGIGLVYHFAPTPEGRAGDRAAALPPARETPAVPPRVPVVPVTAKVEPVAAPVPPVEEPAKAADAVPPPEPPPTVKPRAATPIGQIRGLVRSFKGVALHATIEIDPMNREFPTAPDGTFEVDVPPGRYKVKVKAAGFSSQYSTIRVEENGVTILNADLHRRGRGR